MAKKSTIFKRLFQVLVLALVAVVLFVVTQYYDILTHQIDVVKSGPILVEEDFESGSLSKWSQEDLCCDHSLQFVSSPTRNGSQAAAFEWTYDDLPLTKQRARSEIKRYGLFGLGTERWYSVSTYLPEDYETADASNLVVQWHDFPDFFLGEKFRQPPLALTTRGDEWSLLRRWDPDWINAKVGPRGGSERLSLGKYERGKWTDWVFHVKWSAGDSGIFELWQDDELVVEREGPNTYRDLIAPYFKTGVYQQKEAGATDFSVDRRKLFLDEIRIGNERATYEDIAPSAYADR
ncbi:MAG: polysaccharide lyase [Synechococcus sp.]